MPPAPAMLANEVRPFRACVEDRCLLRTWPVGRSGRRHKYFPLGGLENATPVTCFVGKRDFFALEAFFCESLIACERVVSTVKRVDGPASRRLAIAGALILLAGASTSKAAVIFSDNFDGYANQAALQAAWPTIATTTDTTKQNIQLSTAQAQSTANSVYVPVSTTATTTSMEYRNRAAFLRPVRKVLREISASVTRSCGASISTTPIPPVRRSEISPTSRTQPRQASPINWFPWA